MADAGQGEGGGDARMREVKIVAGGTGTFGARLVGMVHGVVLLTMLAGDPVHAQTTAAGETPAEAPDEPWWAPWDDLPPGVYVVPVDSLYEFEANDAGEILRELESRGPIHEMERFYGQQSATWSYEFTWSRPAPGLCAPEDLRILARSVIVLPRLVNLDTLEPGLRTDWVGFLLSLRDHELRHRAIVEEHLIGLRDRLLKAPPRPCSEFPAALDPILDDARNELRIRHERFDARTEHGVLNGAAWPPPSNGRGGEG